MHASFVMSSWYSTVRTVKYRYRYFIDRMIIRATNHIDFLLPSSCVRKEGFSYEYRDGTVRYSTVCKQMRSSAWVHVSESCTRSSRSSLSTIQNTAVKEISLVTVGVSGQDHARSEARVLVWHEWHHDLRPMTPSTTPIQILVPGWVLMTTRITWYSTWYYSIVSFSLESWCILVGINLPQYVSIWMPFLVDTYLNRFRTRGDFTTSCWRMQLWHTYMKNWISTFIGSASSARSERMNEEWMKNMSFEKLRTTVVLGLLYRNEYSF
jgi:hypothetical protein